MPLEVASSCGTMGVMDPKRTNHALTAFNAIAAARRRYGQARIELGIYLEHVRLTEAWRLRNETFAAFLEEERINEKAAYQYMRVARRFVFELAVDDATLAELAMVNMATLDLAARVTTPESLEETLAIITTLSERDARVELEAIEAETVREPTGKRREKGVEKVLRLYRELPDDQRIDVRNVLRTQGGASGHARRSQ